MNGASYLFPGEDLGKGVTSLEAAYAMLPADEDIVMLLAKAYTAAGRKADAAPLLRTIIARARSARADEARRLLGEELAEAE
jgi:thioredoxin-like negative regulator of GroEL